MDLSGRSTLDSGLESAPLLRHDFRGIGTLAGLVPRDGEDSFFRLLEELLA